MLDERIGTTAEVRDIDGIQPWVIADDLSSTHEPLSVLPVMGCDFSVEHDLVDWEKIDRDGQYA